MAPLVTILIGSVESVGNARACVGSALRGPYCGGGFGIHASASVRSCSVKSNCPSACSPRPPKNGP